MPGPGRSRWEVCLCQSSPAFWPWGCFLAWPSFSFLVQIISTFSVILRIKWNNAERSHCWRCSEQLGFRVARPRDTHFTELSYRPSGQQSSSHFCRAQQKLYGILKSIWKLELVFHLLEKKKHLNSGTRIHKFHKRSCHALNCSFYLQMGCLDCRVARWWGVYSPTNLKGRGGIWNLFWHSAQEDYLNYIFKYVWYLREAQSKNLECVLYSYKSICFISRIKAGKPYYFSRT